MATAPSKEVAFPPLDGPVLRLAVRGVWRGALIGGAAGFGVALLLIVNRLTSPDTRSLAASLQLFMVGAYCVVATSGGAIPGAVGGGLIALTGYDRPRWLPVIGGAGAACAWLAWVRLLYGSNQGPPDWTGLFLLGLPFAVPAGVLHGVWLRKLRAHCHSYASRRTTD